MAFGALFLFLPKISCDKNASAELALPALGDTGFTYRPLSFVILISATINSQFDLASIDRKYIFQAPFFSKPYAHSLLGFAIPSTTGSGAVSITPFAALIFTYPSSGDGHV